MKEWVRARFSLDRREALAWALATVGALVAGSLMRRAARASPVPLRPPGALAEHDFLAACIRCFQCGSVCPNQCIRFGTLADGAVQAFTPYIEPREQACILCMKCTQACPTDALAPIADDGESIAKTVKMGVARVNEDLCYSYNGRACGVCYYACPFPDTALRLKLYARPVIDDEACVGCGGCERACIRLPQAVRIIPKGAEERAA